ncbi:MAG: hypothetical protein SF182_26970 [Deltaproteobacteria bacterium]|nr:hypothetical protein [Deltaproteobacteria bacterium]
MRRDRWLIFTFVPALLLFNAFVVLNYTGLAYEPFSWKAFAQMYPDGAACVLDADCQSGNCVDDVCCNSACDGPDQLCDQPGREGTCVTVQTAPAPALSGLGLLVASLILTGLGGIGLLRRRRANS